MVNIFCAYLKWSTIATKTGSTLQVCSGEVLTVRIPTADDGRFIYWEFATDDYDLAFGVSFEWNKCPDAEVTLDVNDSASEGEDDLWDDDDHLTDIVSVSEIREFQ